MNEVPGTMLSLLLTEPGKRELRRVPVPKPGSNEVLCRIQAVAICGSDPKIIRGDTAGKWPPSYPFIAGHEWAGEVVAVGENVFGFECGDRVAGEAHAGCGFCARCLSGYYNLCENYGKPETGHRHYGHLSNGAYAQYNVFMPRSLTKMPDNVSFAEGALVDPAGTALHCLQLTGITPGGTVVVIGPGPIGLIAMRMSRIFGAGKVIVVGRGGRLASAMRLGADVGIDFTKMDSVAAIHAATNGMGADEVFECSGAEGTLDEAIRMVRRGGKIGLIGIPPAEIREKVPFAEIVLDEKTIYGSRANPNVSAMVLDLIGSGQLVVRDLITHRFPLAEFEKGFEVFLTRIDGALKVIVEPNGASDNCARGY